LLVNLAQGAIGRLRPNEGDSQWAFAAPLAGLTQGIPSGFPSGEAATAFAMAVALSRAWPRGRRYFYTLALLTVLARVLPGSHYLSDVVAGAMAGAVLARLFFDLAFKGHGWLEERVQRSRAHGSVTACADE
jgi:membrane-associated phospholipid phosphatase